jgi:hypothetical protein
MSLEVDTRLLVIGRQGKTSDTSASRRFTETPSKTPPCTGRFYGANRTQPCRV